MVAGENNCINNYNISDYVNVFKAANIIIGSKKHLYFIYKYLDQSTQIK
jgi:hypothetical protein